MNKIVFAVGSILLGAAFLPLRAQKKIPRVSSGPAGEAVSKVWKSQTTGKEYRVKVEKDVFYAEWTPGPEASAQRGAYIRTECRRSGSKWYGVSRSYLSCEAEDKVKGRVTNWCHLTTRTEIDTLTADRIVGRTESLHRFDCRSCKILEAAMAGFVWVPKR
jgi:hypothetical protein